jgi:hypothetical protein
VGAIVTNTHRRRSITHQVIAELQTRYEVLATIRSDAALLYATTAGRIHLLRRSNGMDDYEVAAKRILEWTGRDE